jgi:multidrug resistance protein
MQSFLQYRRFGRHVARQYERDLSKAEALSGAQETSGSVSPSSSKGNTPAPPIESEAVRAQDYAEEDTRDPEKGEQLAGTAGGVQAQNHHSWTEDLEEQLVEKHGERFQPIQAAPSGRKGPMAGEEENHMSRVSTIATRHSLGTALGTTLTGIDVRDRSIREGGEGKVFVVGYEGEKDIMNPHNWSFVTRIGATVNIASIGWIVGFASSVDSAALRQASMDFGVSEVTESLATGLFLIGFGVGALFAGPISETIGRNPVYIATLSLYMIFVMASALAPNIGAQIAFRFIAGCFAATPLTCAGGSISDLWSPMERVYAFPVFANAALMGPIFGPVVGGFIGQSSRVSWRWTEWITLIISGLVLFNVVLFQPETYAPILLKWKASRLREVTGDDRYKAEVEIRDVTFIKRLGRALYRPFLLTFSEPIIILIALYLTVIYIILFTFLDGYDFVFTQTYGFSEGITGLSFMGIGIGLCLASLLVPIIYVWAKRDLAKIKEQGGDRLPPEFRLWFAMFGAPAIPISMLWMGWTAYPNISYWSPLSASVLFGYGILCVFISSYQYIIDAYEVYAASALASVTLIRYVAAGGMVEVAIPFYKRLGVHWTLTILGCLSALLVPVPYLFYLYGVKIRKRSKYAIA